MSNIRYARVWLYTWDEYGVFVRMNEEPEGIITIRDWSGKSWVKIGQKWFRAVGGTGTGMRSLGLHLGEGIVAYLSFISHSEYETDLEFELFKKLRVTYRPVRTWIKRNPNLLLRWNLIILGLSFWLFFQLLIMSEEPSDGMFIGAINMMFTFLLSIIFMFMFNRR